MDTQICPFCGSKVNGKNIGTFIEKLGLSGRVYNCLKRKEIDFVEQLVKLSPADILRFRNIGAKSIKELQEKLKSFGVDWWAD
jgi:DNA-directed RNA polymerase subunit alpha